MRHYEDFFSVPLGYKANMTREAINETPDTWLQFYPHAKYIEFLRTLLLQLDGGSKSLWLTGNYGTGKSFAALVTQKLFMDDGDRVQAWFEKRKQQFPKDADGNLHEVPRALFARRQDNTFVIYDYNASGLGPNEDFLVRLERTIVSALNEANLLIPPKAQLNEMLGRLREEGANFFRARDAIQDRLAKLHKGISTTDQLIAEFEKRPFQDGLLEDVQKVLHERNIFLGVTAERFLSWIMEVLDRNKLGKIVYIFDEFSTFIEAHKDELKTFEEVAEYANTGKFYFVPVTHLSINAYWAEGSASAKKANGRFFFRELQMPNDTAFQLAADAMKTNPETEAEWDAEKAQLWSAVSDFAGIHFNEEDVSKKSLHGILPIHPMAAFLLKFLSTSAGDNQRSVFEYLKGSANGTEFRDFIHEGGPAVPGKQFLTVDYLWKYFMERDDLGLNKELVEIRAAYERIVKREFQSRTPDDEDVRVLKTVMLYCLLNELNPGGHDRLRPTVENVELAFKGDGAIVGVRQIVKGLADKQCFTLVNENIELFRSSVGGAELEKKIKELESKFHSLLSEKTADDLYNHIKNDNPAGRLEVRVFDGANLNASQLTTTTRERYSKNGNQVLLCFVVAKDKGEQLQIPDKIRAFLRHFHDHRIVCLAFPNLTFCDKNADMWNEYIKQYGQMLLSNDTIAKKQYLGSISKMNGDWFTRIKARDQVIKAYRPVEGAECTVTEITWDTLRALLTGFIQATLPNCVDQFAQGQLTAFGSRYYKAWATAGIQFDSVSSNPYKQLVDSFKKQGITADQQWFALNPNHPITRTKDLLERKIENTVGRGKNFSIRKAYIDLRRPSFGMRPIVLSAFVLGLALRGILAKGYQWTNGQITEPLDGNTLAEIIESVVKDDGNDNIHYEKLICRLSKEERFFVEQAPKMFGVVSPDPNATVETALLTILDRIEKICGRVPMWILPEYVSGKSDPHAELIGKVVNNLCLAAIISSKGKTEERTNAVKEIGALLLQLPDLVGAVGQYVKSEVFELAFQAYVGKRSPQLASLAEAIGDNTFTYCQAIKDKAIETAGWLWKQPDLQAEIDRTICEYQVIAKIQLLLGLSEYMPYRTALGHLRTKITVVNKLPKAIILARYPTLGDLLESITKPDNVNVANILSNSLSHNHGIIEKLFFDPVTGLQLTILKEQLGLDATFREDDLRTIYSQLQGGFHLEEYPFLVEVRNKISQLRKQSIIGRLRLAWKDLSGQMHPDEWALSIGLPAWTFFGTPAQAADILQALTIPDSFSSEKLQNLLTSLSQMKAPDAVKCQTRFIHEVIPGRYLQFDISLPALVDFMSAHYGNQPNNWPTKPDVNDFVAQQYKHSFAAQIANKINNMSGADLKEKLLQLSLDNPDIGLAFWE
ncbi:MAG: hypothetical protein M0Z41_08465 [Peptococcaceae bacterium]|jgi:hypothetical protein|nr:hypothetical protein [Peptococcaceae bacterium]